MCKVRGGGCEGSQWGIDRQDGRHPRIRRSGSPTTSNGPGNHEVEGVRKVPGRRPPEAVGACEGQQATIPYVNQQRSKRVARATDKLVDQENDAQPTN
ncbi:hypothetical protein R1flu_007103 [Riccia fluitans]|uniref:Uncharacterized protein n=1 Tax=Riccia fluitans TaxID=41844 RepID=A0ABD1YZ11_9MARC